MPAAHCSPSAESSLSRSGNTPRAAAGPAAVASPPQPDKRTHGARAAERAPMIYRCSHCEGRGHNVRSCPLIARERRVRLPEGARATLCQCGCAREGVVRLGARLYCDRTAAFLRAATP